jgi:hypothetical protein
MKKILPLLISALVLASCSPASVWQDANCPAPAKDQIEPDGVLTVQKGVTLKCQIKQYSSRMSCTAVTDKEKFDGWLCDNGEKKALFLFDKNGVLTEAKIF